MGTSHPETKPWVIERIHACRARSVLDVGAGAGNWLDCLRASGYTGQVDAVEVWSPYIDQFRLRQRYDRVHQVDARTLGRTVFAQYDVVIFGDVLEHMTRDEAIHLWSEAAAAAHAAIAIPIIHYHQGPLAGNPYEVHVVDDWTHQQVLDTFTGIAESQAFTITGAYWR